MKPKTVEEQYKKMSQIEHILQRPDTYIGSIQRQSDFMWVHAHNKMEYREIEYVPGLYKIFDEILVNAADNFQRDATMTYIKVTLGNTITVRNDGKPIPITIHKEHGIYVPELIFGVLLTGSNYDDTEKRVVGGRNGFGAKLTNVYSTEFSVEVCDGMQHFKQTWTNNMSNKQIPQIKPMKKEPFVSISFHPDYKRFGMKEMEDDLLKLLTKRVYDMAGIFGDRLKVFLDDNKLKIGSFSKYVDLYLNENAIKISDKEMTTSRWEVVVSYSPTQFQQVSFVNGISTSKGGTHINYVTDKIVQEIQNELALNKKYKNIEIQKYQIKGSLWVFLNCLIDNPTFDSQTKENMTTKVSEFGGSAQEKFKVTEKFSKALIKTDIIEAIVAQAKAKQDAKLNKHMKGAKNSRLHGIEKLDDANDAGKRNSDQCTLILTEGDSAKALAMSGIDVVGRDRYGVFPLKGKLLNVREANMKQIMNNEEIENLIKIVGLQKDKQYTDLKSLRYGCIMIMADQDIDGSHIKGLIINFIHHFWPSLIQYKGFVKEFVTPLIKATKLQQTIPFFTVQDFKKFSMETDIKGWYIKYYKGLGTSDDLEAQEYFKNLQMHQICFRYENEEDDESIDLCFNKKKTNERKQWLANYDVDLYVDHTKKELRYHDFIHRELIHYSMADNIRSIPSIMDGLKPGQRKILYSCFKRNLKQEIKVVQLGGYVAEHSAYHHGDMSLTTTIIGMAQNYVGSNNINLLMPRGQFGSRAMGGKDHASARYISTHLNKLTRFIFPEPDDHSLDYQEDDGAIVEPLYYMPIIPMSLVNGAEGIGTGWSTSVSNYNPRELVEQMRQRLNGKPFDEIMPFYKHFDGVIEEGPNNSFYIKGLVSMDPNTDIVTIKELPVRKWTKNYKDWLDKEMQDEESDMLDLREYHTKQKIHFDIQMREGFVSQCKNPYEYFKLSTALQTTNMVLFNSTGNIRKYESVIAIMEEFYEVRLHFYQLRKDYMLSKLDREVMLLDNKVRFIQMVISDEIKIRNVKKQLLVQQLDQLGFTRFSKLVQVKSTKLKAGTEKKPKQVSGSESGSGSGSESDIGKGTKKGKDNVDSDIQEFNYLLSMSLFSLTYEKVVKLLNEQNTRIEQREQLKDKPIKDIWEEDLDNFLVALDQAEQLERISMNQAEKKAQKPMKKPNKKKQQEEQPQENKDQQKLKRQKQKGDEKPKDDEQKQQVISQTSQQIPSIKERIKSRIIEEQSQLIPKERNYRKIKREVEDDEYDPNQ